jgi:hypothetical protein
MRADQKAQLSRIAPHQTINAVRGDHSFKLARAVVPDRTETARRLHQRRDGGLEIVVDKSVGPRMQRQITRLAAFARHFEMRDAFANVA